MGDAQGFGANGPIEEGRQRPAPGEVRPRAVGSPLPIGSGNSSTQPGPLSESPRGVAPLPPGRALANSAADEPLDVPSGVQRAVSAFRAALPFVQRILPLLEANLGNAVSHVLTPRRQAPPPQPPPQPPVNLAPIEDGLAELQSQHRELRDQVVEQNSSLKRVEDQLEMVREATDRNTLEQQELMEDLKGVGTKINVVALIALGLLAVSILINIVLYLHILRVLP